MDIVGSATVFSGNSKGALLLPVLFNPWINRSRHRHAVHPQRAGPNCHLQDDQTVQTAHSGLYYRHKKMPDRCRQHRLLWPFRQRLPILRHCLRLLLDHAINIRQLPLEKEKRWRKEGRVHTFINERLDRTSWTKSWERAYQRRAKWT